METAEAFMLIRLVLQTLAMLAVFALILFGAAGTSRWTEAWFMLVMVGVLSVGTGLWLAWRDPALLRSRLSSPFSADQAEGDRRLITAIGIGFLAWMVLIGLDRRFRWSAVPALVEAVGAVVLLAGFAGVLWTFAANSYAAPQIRLQGERGQTVVDTGPYALVRHPMYSAAALYLVGMAMLLGSWWGLAGAAGLIVSFGLRALGEERLLRSGLEGYEAYSKRVRYRLLPGVW